MKLLQSALALCILVGSLALAEEPKDKCGCSAKPKPAAPAQVVKPAPHKSACAEPVKECAKPKA